MAGGMLDVGGIEARLGAKVDERGFREFDRAMAKVEHSEATAKLSARVDEKGFLRFKALSGDANKSTDSLIGKMRNANISTTFFSRTLSLIKWPAFIAGAGAAASGIVALTGGVVALTSALAPLSGLLVAYPALLGAVGQAAGVVALAGIGDLTEAMAGNEDALKRLTPQARKFLDTLKGFQPQFDKLQSTAQGPLFEGLGAGLKSAMDNFGAFRRVVGTTSEVMGDLAEKAGDFLGRKGFGKDFETIGEGNAKLLNRLGRAGLHLGDALRHILVAAQPLIGWLGKLAVQGGKWAEEAAKAGRHSGRLAEFFEKTRKVAERLGSIVSHLAGAFGEIGKAAAPLGRSILRAFDDSAESFERWTKSIQGKNALKDFFHDIRGPLFEMGRLVRDIGGGLLSMGGDSNLKPLIRQVRTELLPPVLTMVEATTKAFGPAMLDFLVSLAKLLTNFAGGAGPLTLFVKGLTGLTDGLNWIMDQSSVIKGSLVTIFSAFSVVSAIGLSSAVSNLFGFRRGLETIRKFPGMDRAFKALSSGFQLVSDAAHVAKNVAAEWVGNFVGSIKAKAGRVKKVLVDTVLKGRAMISSVAGAAAELGGQLVAGLSGRIRRGATRIKDALGRVLRGRAVMGAVEGGAFAIGDTLIGGIGGRVKQKSGRLKGIGTMMGRFMGAAMLASFILFANDILDWFDKNMPGSVSKDWQKKNRREAITEQSGGSGFLGIDAPIDLPGLPPWLGGQRGGLVTPGGIIPWQGFQWGGQVGRGPGPRDTVPAMLEPGEIVIPKGKARKGIGSPVGEEAVKETERRTKKIRKRIEEDFGDAGKKAKEEQKDLEKGVKKSWRDMDRDHERRSGAMKRRTADSFGSMADTAKSRSDKLSGAVGGSMGSVQQSVFAGMSYIVSATTKALKAFDAKAIHLSVPKPSAEKHAQGGMIAGQGRQDTVPLMLGMAAPGEAILTRHQQGWVEEALRSTFGMGLMDLFGRERRPHGFQQGGMLDTFNQGGKTRGGGKGGDKAAKGDSRMAAIMREADRIDKLHSSYLYGGGHVTPAPASPPWDCSSSVSRLLQYAGYDVPTMVSGDFASRFPGGKGAMSILSNADHVYAVINGRAWGTSESNIGHGPGWIDEYTYRSGFNVSHVPGLGAAAGIGTTHIKRPLVEGTAGPMHDLTQAVIDRVHAGAQGKLKRAGRRAGRMGGQALNEFGGGGGALSAAQFDAAAAQALRLTGHGASPQAVGSLRTLAGKESSLNPTAVNPITVLGQHASGIMQMLPSTFRAHHEPRTSNNIFDVLANIASSVNYQYAQYGGLTTASPYAQGGILGDTPGTLHDLYGRLRHLRRPADRARELRRYLRRFPIEGKHGKLDLTASERRRLQRKLKRLEARGPHTRGQDRIRGRIAGLTIGGLDTLFDTAELEGASPGGIATGLKQLRVRSGMGLGALSEYSGGKAAQIRASMRIGAAQRRVFSGFGLGGVVASPAVAMGVGGGGDAPVIVNPTFIFEEDSGAFVGRVRMIHQGREREVARKAGVARYTPSSTGRSARYS